ncbi:MAG: hypothetical protein DHS20C01_22940 [marine bacterium B5-7]|nr:MAG: hypothetical protein DHS20C01_22940 [marine bacterium B5-7]
MYLPAPFQENDPAAALKLIANYPFATLISHGDKPWISHVPLLVQDPVTPVLFGHLARENPQSADILAGGRVTAVFAGPHAYISPTWYTTPQMVPTWNFVVVHVEGVVSAITAHDDLSRLVEDLADYFERGSDNPWIPDYPPAMLDAIIGFTLTADTVRAKFKLSQNKSRDDRVGVVDALEQGGVGDRALAAIMREHGLVDN